MEIQSSSEPKTMKYGRMSRRIKALLEVWQAAHHLLPMKPVPMANAMQ